MHHPFEWLADFDADDVRTALEHRGVFVLMGHDHSSDPTTEWSKRGAALYSRAGCLYAGRDYSNSYTILDLDLDRRTVELQIRRWWPNLGDRGAFGPASDLADGGQLSLPWPDASSTLAVHTVGVSEVLEPLAQMAKDLSVLDEPANAELQARVDDLLVPPRFWPVPDPQVFDATVSDQPIGPASSTL